MALDDRGLDPNRRRISRDARKKGWYPIMKIFKTGGQLDTPLNDITLKSNSRDPIRCAILFLYSLDSFIFNVLNGVCME